MVTAVTEISIGEAWIYGVLEGDATLAGLGYNDSRIWSAIAPSDTPYPFILVSRQASSDVNGLGNKLARIMSSVLFQVAAHDQGPQWADVAGAAARIDELLHGKAGELLDDDESTVLGRVLSCVREQPLSIVEAVEGRHYRRLGGLYRLLIQGA